MRKDLRILSLNFNFAGSTTNDDFLYTERALFDFDVVLIRPPEFNFQPGRSAICENLLSTMAAKKRELEPFFSQGGVLVVLLEAPHRYRVEGGYGNTQIVDNYDFLDPDFATCLRKGKGNQITYNNSAEPFAEVLKKSNVAWTAYIHQTPTGTMKGLKFFAHAGAAGPLAGKMPRGEGHIVILPNLDYLDEKSFLEACGDYRFKRQGTPPPDWVGKVFVPGVHPIEGAIVALDKQIAELQKAHEARRLELDERSAYRKLLYEKGKTQLEPIVLRALDDLGFATSPGETLKGNHEIDGRTSKGSSRGIVEVKGSKNQISQSEFSSFVTKIVVDAEVNNGYGKGILVGNGLCESEPGGRIGNAVFTGHVIDGATRHSIALVNSVELYWLCCALLRGDKIDKDAVREVILTTNGYVDLKPFCGEPLWTATPKAPSKIGPPLPTDKK